MLIDDNKQKLYKIKHDKYCLPFIDLAVRARVMVTRNLAIQIKIYNGATGIVVGFGFHKAIPEENFPTVNTFHTLKNRELPIVFVKLDRYNYLLMKIIITLFHLQNVLVKCD